MTGSKYTFEKLRKERAKRQKRIEKSAQRLMAKKARAEGEPAGTETPGTAEDAGQAAEREDEQDHE